MKQDDRDKAFARNLSEEVGQNVDAIQEIFAGSKVGQCGGKCQGFKEEDLSNLCPDCFQALEEESEQIFSTSPKLRLLGDAMNNHD